MMTRLKNSLEQFNIKLNPEESVNSKTSHLKFSGQKNKMEKKWRKPKNDMKYC